MNPQFTITGKVSPLSDHVEDERVGLTEWMFGADGQGNWPDKSAADISGQLGEALAQVCCQDPFNCDRPCVERGRELERRDHVEPLLEALIAVREMLRMNPAMQRREFVGLGLQVNEAIDRVKWRS